MVLTLPSIPIAFGAGGVSGGVAGGLMGGIIGSILGGLLGLIAGLLSAAAAGLGVLGVDQATATLGGVTGGALLGAQEAVLQAGQTAYAAEIEAMMAQAGL